MRERTAMSSALTKERARQLDHSCARRRGRRVGAGIQRQWQCARHWRSSSRGCCQGGGRTGAADSHPAASATTPGEWRSLLCTVWPIRTAPPLLTDAATSPHTQSLNSTDGLLDWAYSSEAGAGDWARVVRLLLILRDTLSLCCTGVLFRERWHPFRAQAALAPVVTAAAEEGDAVALDIIDSAANGLIHGGLALPLLPLHQAGSRDCSWLCATLSRATPSAASEPLTLAGSFLCAAAAVVATKLGFCPIAGDGALSPAAAGQLFTLVVAGGVFEANEGVGRVARAFREKAAVRLPQATVVAATMEMAAVGAAQIALKSLL